MGSKIQIPSEGRAVKSGGERESPEPREDQAQQVVSSGDDERNTEDTGAEHDEIAILAYSYWEERGGGGSAEEDWLRAEEELRNRRSAPKTFRAGS
jgi:hypothetical protein